MNSLPRSWAQTSLDDVSWINPKLPASDAEKDLEVTFLPMRCVEEQSGRIDLSLTRKLSEVRKGYTYFRNEDILFAKITPCMENGKVAIANDLKNGIGFGSTEFHVIRLVNELSRKFLFYYLNRENLRKEARKNMTGSAGQLRVPTGFIEELQFPIPPLPEQYRIVSKIEELFTKLDAGVKALKEIKVQLKRYRQSVLKAAFEGKLTMAYREQHKSEMEPASVLLEHIKQIRIEQARKEGKTPKEFPSINTSDLPTLPNGWVWTKLGEISSNITKGSTPTSYGYAYTKSGIRFIKTESIDQRGNIAGDTDYIDNGTNGFLKRSILQAQDLLFSIAGTIGRVGLVRPRDLPANTNQALAIIRCCWEYIDTKYLFRYLKSPSIQVQALKSIVGVGRANVSLTDLGEFDLPLPPLSEQHQIVSEIECRISVADAIEKAVEQSLEQSDRLRQSVLKRAFEGRIVPQDPNDEPAEKLLERIVMEKDRHSISHRPGTGGKRI